MLVLAMTWRSFRGSLVPDGYVIISDSVRWSTNYELFVKTTIF